MPYLMLWIVAVVAVALIWWKFFRPATQTPSASLTAHQAPAQRTATPTGDRPTSMQKPAPAVRAEAPPAELAAFNWLSETDLDAARRDTLLATIQGIPRPPRSLQQLLSPEFVAKAGSAELSELVMGEPLIAARVLSTVNAPFYGLHKPVTNIGQSVTFLGINSVRSICLQYMLAEAFKPKLAEAQRSFDAIWRSSAIASELCVRLGKALNMPDQGSLSTKVVLSFVGQLATASLIPAVGLEKWLLCDRLQRAKLEQELLGLNACEIGCLLMKHWELPADLVNEVGDLGRQLINPYMTNDPVRAPRLALGYLCARLGERLALGQLGSLEGYDAMKDDGLDTFHLRAALTHPTLARLEQALASPEVQTAVQQMMGKPAA